MLKNVMRGLAIGFTIVAVSGIPARGASVEADRGVVVETLVGGYVEAWKTFYPSRAVALGMRGAIRDLEDRSAAAIEGWIDFNRRTLDGVEDLLGLGSGPVARRAVRGELSLAPDQAVDLRLLRTKIRRELATWDEQRIHRSSLGVFVDPMAGALGPVLESPLLSVTEREDLLARRLDGMVELANAARDLLEGGRPTEMRRSLEALEETKRDLETELSEAISESSGSVRDALEGKRRDAIDALEELRRHVVERTIPAATSPDTEILGRERYGRELALYTDSSLTPEELEALALREIRSAKRHIAEVAEVYWRETSPEIALPESSEEIVAKAFADLEARRPANNAEYLETLREYRREVESFVRDREIATVPERHTLSLELAPESAGPMARVGYVSTPPPFDPNPWTTWYLATIPDSHPEQERVDFWRSFNYPFKKFIVIHELFPGHYMQLKLLRENLHQVRILFPWSPFTEGWATFCEEVVFEHGYAEGDHLVRLAQLRKRLENANRAYMSVQAHVNGWSEEEVVRTSVEMSLLAPQFAKSLWNRLMRWPFQMTTYMLGGLQLQELYDAEKDRLGPRFNTRNFMDTALRLGPIPIEEIGVFLELANPTVSRVAEERPPIPSPAVLLGAAGRSASGVPAPGMIPTMNFADRIVQAVQNANARISRGVEASEELRRQWEGRRDQIRTVLREAEHALIGQGVPARHEDHGDSVSLEVERRGVEHVLVFRPTDQAHDGRLLVAVEAGLEGRLDELLVPDREPVEAKVIEFVEAVAAP